MEQPNLLFSNPQIDLSGLPQVEHMNIIRLETDYRLVRYISASVTALIMVLVAWGFVIMGPLFSSSDESVGGLLAYSQLLATALTLLAIWIVLYSGISYQYMGYALREKDISFVSGWLWKSMVTVPFNRVQHCDIKQGIMDRQFGLSKLTIYTAGGQSADLMIPGLRPDEAEKLKTYILKATEQAAENE